MTISETITDPEVIQEFTSEALELLNEAEESLMLLGSNEHFQNHYDRVYRSFHSIKGGAGMMGWMGLNKAFHYWEDILTSNKKKGPFDDSLIQYFLKTLDLARDILSKQKDRPLPLNPPVAPHSKVKKQTLSHKAPFLKPTAEHKYQLYIVDDEKDICDILTQSMDSKRFNVCAFTDSRKCLASIEENAPDILITDYKMPNTDGVQLITALKKSHPNAISILLSGFLNTQICMDAVEAGTYALISKPLEIKHLESVLDRAYQHIQSKRLMTRSINLLLYQFSDLESILVDANRSDILMSLKEELKDLVREKNQLFPRKSPKRIKKLTAA